MDRKLIVMKQDIEDVNDNLIFGGGYTPNNYVKKASLALCVEDNGLNIIERDSNSETMILYKDIASVDFLVCTRMVNSAGIGGGLRLVVHIDIDIHKKDESTSCFEIVRPDSALLIFNALSKNNIPFTDPVNLVKIYTDMPSATQKNRYLMSNFRKLTKKMKVDNPRRD